MINEGNVKAIANMQVCSSNVEVVCAFKKKHTQGCKNHDLTQLGYMSLHLQCCDHLFFIALPSCDRQQMGNKIFDKWRNQYMLTCKNEGCEQRFFSNPKKKMVTFTKSSQKRNPSEKNYYHYFFGNYTNIKPWLHWQSWVSSDHFNKVGSK